MAQNEDEEMYYFPEITNPQTSKVTSGNSFQKKGSGNQPGINAQAGNSNATTGTSKIQSSGQKRSKRQQIESDVTPEEIGVSDPVNKSSKPGKKVTMFPVLSNVNVSHSPGTPNPTAELISNLKRDTTAVNREISPVIAHEIENRMLSPEKPGFFHRAAQILCGTGKTKSDDEDEDEDEQTQDPPKKKVRGASKKFARVIKGKAARQMRTDYEMAETMNEKQKESFNNILSKNAQLQSEINIEKKTNLALNEKLKTLETSNQAFKDQVENLMKERHLHLQKIAQLEAEKAATEIFKTQLDEKLQQCQSKTSKLLAQSEISNKSREKLQDLLGSTAAAERDLYIQNAELTNQLESMKDHLKQVDNNMQSMTAVLQKELTTPKITVSSKNLSEPKPLKKFEECSDSYKRSIVHEYIDALNSEPLLKQKILERLVPEKEIEKVKITPREAIAMAVSVGISESKVEKLKSFLRLKKLDFLPTVKEMRNMIKNIQADYQYENIEDKEKGIYCRRAVDVEDVIKTRLTGVLTSENYEDVPGFEDCAFMGINLDKGGGQIKFTITACNVKKGKASPNNSAMIGVAVAPKDEYDTYKYCFGKNFDQINELDGKFMEFNINGQIIRKKIIFIVCCDGKMQSILAGHAGAAATNPCYTCEATKSEINEGISASLRTAERMKQQAEDFLKNGNLPQSKCINRPPLLTIPMERWIYGELHAVSGPAVKVLKKVEEIALDEDLKELGIEIPTNKEEKKKAAILQNRIEAIKAEITDLQNAFSVSKTILKARKAHQRNRVQPFTGQCIAKFCLKEVLEDKSLFNTCLNCTECQNFVHSTCELILLEEDIKDCQEIGYSCSACNFVSEEDFQKEFEETRKIWEESLAERKSELTEAENSKDKIVIPYEKCVRYQKIQQKLKYLKIRKAKGFQTLNGVDVRKLVQNGDTFSEAVVPRLQEAVKTFLRCLNTYQELARPEIINDAQINALETERLLGAYREICGNKITPKLHDLTTHTITFMKTFHFYQWSSDQPIEHVHALVNYLLRTETSANKDHQSQLKAITNHFSLRNMLFDSGLNIGALKGKTLKEKQDIVEALKK